MRKLILIVLIISTNLYAEVCKLDFNKANSEQKIEILRNCASSGYAPSDINSLIKNRKAYLKKIQPTTETLFKNWKDSIHYELNFYDTSKDRFTFISSVKFYKESPIAFVITLAQDAISIDGYGMINQEAFFNLNGDFLGIHSEPFFTLND